VVRVNREERRRAGRRRPSSDVWSDTPPAFLSAPPLIGDLSGWKRFEDLDDLDEAWDEQTHVDAHAGECSVCRLFGIKLDGQDAH